MQQITRTLVATLCVVVLAAACAGPAKAPSGAAAAVAAPDRSDADRALDAGRQPAEMLAFFEIGPGMRVAEIGAGGGYTTELLARVVGPTGRVYGQNSKFVLERFAEKPWSERLAKPVNAAIVRVDREFDDPLPPEAKNLDAVLSVLIYHDTVWLETDRARMNAAIFAALKSGGYLRCDRPQRASRRRHERGEDPAPDRGERGRRPRSRRPASSSTPRPTSCATPTTRATGTTRPARPGTRRGTSDRFVLKFRKP